MSLHQGAIGQEEAGDVRRRSGQDQGRRDGGAHRGPTAEDQVPGYRGRTREGERERLIAKERGRGTKSIAIE